PRWEARRAHRVRPSINSRRVTDVSSFPARMTIYAEYEIPQVEGRPAAAGPSAPSFRGPPGGPCLPVSIHFSAHEIIPRLPLPNQREVIAANECFCWQGARIIVRRHHKSVSASTHDREQVAFMHFTDFPVERKEIA